MHLFIERTGNISHKIASKRSLLLIFFWGGGVGGHPLLKQICDTDCLESIAYEFYKKRRVKMMPKKLR